MSKTRFFTGTLVASSNSLKSIASKRLDIKVRYTLSRKVLSHNITGFREDLVKY